MPRQQAARPRVVLAHDWLCGYRGGEAVLERIAGLIQGHFEPAGLLTMFDDGKSLSPTIDAWRSRGLIHASAVNDLPGAATKLRRWLLPMYPLAVADLSGELAKIHAREPISLVVSTSSAAIKGLHTPEGVPHLCYCHSPARYIWSQASAYAAGESMRDRLRAAGLTVARGPFRSWDRRTARRVTRFIANSTHTAREIQRCFARDSAVIHPPVRTFFFTPGHVVNPSSIDGGDWLWVGALEPYKRIDLAVEAARQAGARLVVIGGGSMLESLRATTPSHVKLLGRISDAEVLGHYRAARFLIFPQIEDFGIVAAEALACGLPVVARRAGGSLDMIEEGVTGAFFDEPSVPAIVSAARRVPTRSEQTIDACRAAAERFAPELFDRSMLREMQVLIHARSTQANSEPRVWHAPS